MKYEILMIFIFFIYLINCEREDEIIKKNNIIITDLFKWASKNNFTFPSIEISSELSPKFVATKTFEKNETILIIPNNIMFNISKALKLISSKNLKNQFERFKSEEYLYIEYEDEELKKEESFLGYILYLMEYRSKKYQKTKFFEEYKYYLKSLKIKPRTRPLLLDYEDASKLYMTYANVLYNSIKKDYEEEILIFKGDSYSKKEIDYEDYIPHRINAQNKGIKINGHKTMVPFLNLFEKDYINYNANYTIEKDGSIRIFAKKNIQKYEEIIISSPKQSNARYLLLEGKTYEKLINYYDEYLLPAFGIAVTNRFDINDPDLEDRYYLNLMDNDFDETAVEWYKDNIDILKDGNRKENVTSSYGYLYEILLNNLKAYNEYLKNFNSQRIYEYFKEPEIRIHVARIVKGESKILEKAYSFAQKKASKYINLNSVRAEGYNDQENKINTDL